MVSGDEPRDLTYERLCFEGLVVSATAHPEGETVRNRAGTTSGGSQDKTVRFASAGWQAGFTMFPNLVLRDHRLSVAARLLYALFVDYARRSESSWPGQVKLAEYLCVTERQLRRYVGELEAADLIESRRRGRGETNVYTLLDLPDRTSVSALDRTPTSALDRTPVSDKEEQQRKRRAVGGADSSPSAVRRTTANDQGQRDRAALAQLSEQLRPFVEPVRRRLAEVAAVKSGSIAPTIAAVARLLRRYPGRDFLPLVDDFVQWSVDGRGRGKSVKDVVRAYSNWIAKEPDVLRKTPPSPAAATRRPSVDDTRQRLEAADR